MPTTMTHPILGYRYEMVLVVACGSGLRCNATTMAVLVMLVVLVILAVHEGRLAAAGRG